MWVYVSVWVCLFWRLSSIYVKSAPDNRIDIQLLISKSRRFINLVSTLHCEPYVSFCWLGDLYWFHLFVLFWRPCGFLRLLAFFFNYLNYLALDSLAGELLHLSYCNYLATGLPPLLLLSTLFLLHITLTPTHSYPSYLSLLLIPLSPIRISSSYPPSFSYPSLFLLHVLLPPVRPSSSYLPLFPIPTPLPPTHPLPNVLT